MRYALSNRRHFAVFIFLVFFTVATASFASAADVQNGHITNDAAVYSGPSYSASVYANAAAGENISVHGEYGQWYEVSYGGRTGYILKECLLVDFSCEYVLSVDEVVDSVSPTPTPTLSPPQTPAPTTTPVPEVVSSNIVECAEKYVGVAYKWGGTTTDGMDCSGFVQKVYSDVGYSIGRTTQLQALEGAEVTDYEPGDILCFGRSKWNIFHTGIYIGDGKFIHSSSPEGVIVSELDGYGLKLIMARRVSNES